LKGALLLTAARGRTAAAGGLTRVAAGAGRRVAPSTDAICVSRSGMSVAFLGRSGAASSVVFADGNGTPQRAIPVSVDAGSPLGWIDDSEVTFVSGGTLTAVNRQGRRRTLPATGVDAAHGSVVLAPGGRYAYLRTGTGPGRLYDLKAATTRELPGIVGDPAFTADGAGMVWFDRPGGGARVHYAATSGGPTTSAPLPVGADQRLSDLAVSPDGSQFVYSVTGTDRVAVLVLAALPSGVTLARSTAGAGESPNWSPTGRFFTVLGGAGAARTIQTVRVPASAGSARTVAEATVSAFATAQVGGDTGAQAWLSDAGVLLPQLPPVTRAAVLWALPGAGGTTTARVRLSVDPSPGDPYALQTEESITLGPGGAGRLPKIRAVTAGQLQPVPAGPQLVRADGDALPGSVQLTFDSDLDAATVRNGIAVTGPDGAAVSATTRYDAATRTVVVRPSGERGQALVLTVGPGLRDVDGTSAPRGTRVELRTSG
ncbi:MAG TPA: Ig-like domain-containing protein, partial [Kineosporiaceae bacterium]|nr:Ig-like domain-containing protein [Kineosporiaceae bacterium]